MASRAATDAPHEQLPRRIVPCLSASTPLENLYETTLLLGENKQNNVAAEGRNRRVLQDIGNLVAKQAEYPCANVSTRIIRNSFAQLLTNEQAAAEKNKKSSTELVNGVLTANGVSVGIFIAAANVLAAQKPPESEVIVINSDEDYKEEKEKKTAKEKKTGERSVRKNVKTLSSILTARSKAACGLAYKPKDLVVDIDATDTDNELAAVEYIDDIYKFYKLSEAVPRKELQLVGISSMLIACKYEEIWAPEVNDFACISDNAYAKDQVLVMEKTVLSKLEWYLTVPTPYVFLVRYIKASTLNDKEMENMVFFLAELSLMHYPTVILYCPSMIAASAVYAARCTLERSPFWMETLKHYTGYSEEQLSFGK